MGSYARGLALESDDREEGKSRARAAFEEHGALVARVCMALLGDVAACEQALERVAREAGGLAYDDDALILPRLLGLARMACATQLSKLPLRGASRGPGASEEAAPPRTERDPSSPQEPAVARVALGRLKPTEREAVVLHLVGGLTAEHVAVACGLDVAAARSRIARGVAQLVEEAEKKS